MVRRHHVAAVPVALLHDDLVAELLDELVARGRGQRAELKRRTVGPDGVGAHRLLRREDPHEAVEVGLSGMIIVRVALALDRLADLIVGQPEGARPHDILLVPVHVLVELLLRVDVGIGVGQRRQERQRGKLELEHHRLVVEAVMVSTITKLFWRALATPWGGWTILFQLAATSCAVSGVPS